MSGRRRSAGALICAVVVIATSACNTGEPSLRVSTTGSSSTSTAASSSPRPSPSPIPTDDRGRAVAAVVAYWAAIDAVSTDPRTKLEDLASVARGQALAQWQTTIAADRAKKLTQVGASQIVAGVATKASGRSFRVVACVDVSDVDVVDAAGKSVVTAGRPDRQSYTYTVDKTADGFFVIEDLLKGKPCDS